MRTACALVAGALTLFVSMRAAAVSGGPAAQARTLNLEPTVAQRPEWKPFINLFGQKPSPKPPSIDWNWRPSADQNPAAKASVVCGMTLLPADPKIDAGIRHVPDRGVAITMRAVTPPVCKR